MRVIFVTLSGTETEHELREDTTVWQARSKAATSRDVQIGWVSLMLGESELTDDSSLLRDLEAGSDIRLTVCVRSPWSWAEKVDGTLLCLDEYRPDQELSILLKHFNDGNGREGHGRIVVSGKFPDTPVEILAFLRGEPWTQNDLQFYIFDGVQCWARDGEDGADWRPVRVLCRAHPGDIVQHHTVEWADGKGRSGRDGPEIRMLRDEQRGYTTAMTKDYLDRRLCKGGCHEKSLAASFGFVDAEDAWAKLPVAPRNVQCLRRDQLAARPPIACTHESVLPDGDPSGAPWWDVLELHQVGPEHVASVLETTFKCLVLNNSVPDDHKERAARGLRSLIGVSPGDFSEDVQEKASRCNFYTHFRTVPDGEGAFYRVTGLGWDLLVIVANPKDATIAFAFANGTD